ncbi:MAG: hypothetical protein Q8N99_01870 [Nanoarchaeota archaeon]|nr:hypothetical protein [Nanoarchaeota archaeon]
MEEPERDFLEDSEQIPQPLAVIPLKDSLELRIEASFSFSFFGTKKTCDHIHVYRKLWEEGIDISIYRNGRLCLPLRYYKGFDNRNKRQWDFPIDRALEGKQVKRYMIPIVSKLTKAMPKGLTRAYEIRLAEINPFEIHYDDYQQHTRIKKGHKGEGFSTSIIFSKDLIEQELIKGFWNRDWFYPEGFEIGRNVCNDFTIYIADSDELARDIFFKITLIDKYKKKNPDSSLFAQLYSASIQNVAYGYKMRFISHMMDFSRDDLIRLVKSAVKRVIR